MPPVIAVRGLNKTFSKGSKALDAVDLDIQAGEMVALIGASGSGKSTLLRHMAGLIVGDRDNGEVRVLGRTIQADGRLAGNIRFQRGRIGFVFQQFNLVERLKVITNVLAGGLCRTPLRRSLLCWYTREEKLNALEALDRVGIADWAFQRASTLSGGQQQRAAIARTLVQQAQVILADEPIASLDPESSRRVMEILETINREDGRTVVVSLHQVDYAVRFCPRVVALRHGRIVFDGPSTKLKPALLNQIYAGDPDLERPSPGFVDILGHAAA